MKHSLPLVLAALLSAPAAFAGSLLITGGENFHGASYSQTSGGLGFNADWLKNEHRGESASLGLTASLPLGDAVLVSAGARATYLNSDGYAMAFPLGGRIDVKLMGDRVGLYAQGWVAGSGTASGSVHQYQDSSVGVAFRPFKPLQLDVGYRYAKIERDDSRRDLTLADGVYASAGLNF